MIRSIESRGSGKSRFELRLNRDLAARIWGATGPAAPLRLMHMHRAMLPSRATRFFRTAILLGVAACWRCTRSAKFIRAETCAEENESRKQGEYRALHFMPPSGRAATNPTRRYQADFLLGRENARIFRFAASWKGSRFRQPEASFLTTRNS